MMDDPRTDVRWTKRTAPTPHSKPRVLVGLTGLAVAVFLGLPFPSAGEPSLDSRTAFRARENRCWRYRPSERLFTRMMNAAREKADLPKLSLDADASKVARKHTTEMAKRNLLYHTPYSSLVRRVTRWEILGENVGVGGTVDSLHDAFMDSPPHRANILLSRFRHLGVGVMKSDGRMWVTVILENGLDPGTRLRMPRCRPA